MNITALVQKAIQKASLLRLIVVLTTTTKITWLTTTLLSQFQMRMKPCSTPNNYLWKRRSSKINAVASIFQQGRYERVVRLDYWLKIHRSDFMMSASYQMELNFISPKQVQMLKLFAGTDHETRRMLVLYGDHEML